MRYIRPPDPVVTQIDVYTEEKFEDEEDMRERTRTMFKHIDGGSEFDIALALLRDSGWFNGSVLQHVTAIVEQISYLLGAAQDM